MHYFKVGTAVDTLNFFVWADNAAQAVRKVEVFAGEARHNGRSLYVATLIDSLEVPEGDEVTDEPDDVRDARLAEGEDR